MNGGRGFTLIELLVTIAILAIAMSIGVPSMIGFQRNAVLTSATNALSSAINVARGEAMKRNQYAVVTPIGSGWSSGYRVFIDANNNQAYDSASDILIQEQDPTKGANLSNLELSGAGTAAGSAPYLRFDGTGYLRDSSAGFASAAVTLKRIDTKGKADEYKETRNVMIARTGRVRTCKPSGASDANCDPASP